MACYSKYLSDPDIDPTSLHDYETAVHTLSLIT